jgi:thymidylate synthase
MSEFKYLDLLRDVLDNGERHEDRTGTGTRSVFGRQWVHNMSDGFPLLTTKFVSFKNIMNELKWFLSGNTYEPDLAATGTHIWKEWATKEQCAKFGRAEGDLGPVYGRLWRNFAYERDQIADLINDIEHTPNSRRLIVTGWDPCTQRTVALPPCHTLWQVKIHSATSEISLHLYARSIDIFLGLPYNIASYAALLKMLAATFDLMPHQLIISFGDLHLYNNHVEQAKEQLTRLPYALPKSSCRIDEGSPSVSKLMSCEIEITDYVHHPAIKGAVSV